MKVTYSIVFLILFFLGCSEGRDLKKKSRNHRKSNKKCDGSALHGTWQYYSQGSGALYTVLISCSDDTPTCTFFLGGSGICTRIGTIDESAFGVNEDGHCQFGYEDDEQMNVVLSPSPGVDSANYDKDLCGDFEDVAVQLDRGVRGIQIHKNLWHLYFSRDEELANYVLGPRHLIRNP